MLLSRGEGFEMTPMYRNLTLGDPAPWFRQRSTSNSAYAFDTAAGRYVVLCFHSTAGDEAGRAALVAAHANRDLFDDVKACFFGVSIDPQDLASGRVREHLPGLRYFWDFDRTVGRLYGAVPVEESSGQAQVSLRRFWLVLDPMLRVRAVFPFMADGSDRDLVFAYVRTLPPVATFVGFEVQAPVLIIPNVFEREFCQHLISLYEQHGGEESGFMREVDGKTVLVTEPTFKRRRDYVIEDNDLIRETQARILRRIKPWRTRRTSSCACLVQEGAAV
jgi:peroxiredoxin